VGEGRAQLWYQQFVDEDGCPLAGAKVYHYRAGTTTDLDVWADPSKTTTLAQPATADGAGRVKFYGDGDYRLAIQYSDGTFYDELDDIRITRDTSLIWENSNGITLPPANDLNAWQLFALHDGTDLTSLQIRSGGTWTSVFPTSNLVINVAESPYNAQGDGSTDDTTAIQDALDEAALSGGNVYVPSTTSFYFISATLKVPSNVTLFGDAGNGDGVVSEIQSVAITGAAIQIVGRSGAIKRLKISASATRTVSGDSTTHGVLGLRVPDSVGQNSRMELQDLFILSHGGDGVHMIGAEFCWYDNVTAQECRGRGFFSDDGTTDNISGANVTQFESLYTRCRAFECYKAGFFFPGSQASQKHVTLISPEALGCDIDESDGYQMWFTGSNTFVLQPDCEDQQWANTTSSEGNSRPAKSAPSKGIRVQGQGHQIWGGHYSSMTRSIDVIGGTHVSIYNPLIFAGNATGPQADAIVIDSGSIGTVVFSHTSGSGSTAFTDFIQNQDATAFMYIEGVLKLGNAFTPFDDNFVDLTLGTGDILTLLDGHIDVTSGYHVLKAASDTTPIDSLSQIRDSVSTSGAGSLRIGQRLTLSVSSGETITIAHDNSSANEIHLNGSANFVMDNVEDTLSLVWDGAQWLESGRSAA